MNFNKVGKKAFEIFLNDGLVLLIYRSRRFLIRIMFNYIEFVRYVCIGTRRIKKNSASKFVFLDHIDCPTETPEVSVSDRYVCKVFCLLELVWVDCSRDVAKLDLVSSSMLGFVNRSNQKYSLMLLELVGDDYKFCDWALSRLPRQNWPLNEWAARIEFGSDGRDIKHAWELGRLFWLPQMAISANHQHNQPVWKAKVYRECFDVILDFMAFNPVGFGVHWICPMDISIRLVNILVTMQILGKNMREYDPICFDCVVEICLLHKQWIESHLEDWDVRTNHYLSNLIALGVFELMFDRSKRDEALRSLVFDRLFEEVDSQFLGDGGHFERSLGYHNMLTGGIAMFLWLLYKTRDDELINRLVGNHKNALKKISRAFDLSELTTVSDGSYPLIGDFDSGSFVKLRPQYLKLEEVKKIFGGNIPVNLVDSEYEATFLNCNCLEFIRLARDCCNLESNLEINKMMFSYRPSISFEAEDYMNVSKWVVDTADFKFYSFADFGLIVFGNQRWFFSVRAIGELPPYGHGHLHEDQLSACIWNDGVWIWTDPGSGSYTGNPFVRNLYRSVLAHFPTRLIFPVSGSLNREDIFGPLKIQPVGVRSTQAGQDKRIEFLVANKVLLTVVVGATDVSFKFNSAQEGPNQCQPPVSFNYGLY